MAKQKSKRPTTRELKKDISVIVRELFELQKYVNTVLTPMVKANLSLLEKYIEHSGELEQFVATLEREAKNEETINKSSKKRKKKQTERSRATETISKDGKTDGTRSV